MSNVLTDGVKQSFCDTVREAERRELLRLLRSLHQEAFGIYGVQDPIAWLRSTFGIQIPEGVRPIASSGLFYVKESEVAWFAHHRPSGFDMDGEPFLGRFEGYLFWKLSEKTAGLRSLTGYAWGYGGKSSEYGRFVLLQVTREWEAEGEPYGHVIEVRYGPIDPLALEELWECTPYAIVADITRSFEARLESYRTPYEAMGILHDRALKVSLICAGAELGCG